MPRNKADTVEYFPHIARSGKTLSILEGKHGNDGYTFWFKLLETLSTSDGHFYDCSNEVDWQYLISRSRLSDVSATEIIKLLVILGNIDKILWENHKIIWCQALVDNFQEVYRKRKRDLPTKPILDFCDRNEDNCDRNEDNSTVPATEGTQSKVKKSRVKKSKADTPLTPLPPDFDISDAVKIWAGKNGFTRLEDHLESFKDYALSRGKTYADWDSTFRRAIREDWAKLRSGGNGGLRPQPQHISKADAVTAGNLAARERVLSKLQEGE